MFIEEELSKISLPPTYKRNGGDCLLDPYRKRLIDITPEEIVRQKVTKYFEDKLNVPYEMLKLEVRMEHYSEGEKGRADIVIHALEDNGMLRVIAIIECKRTSVQLTDHVINQVSGYANITEAEYFFITNGIDLYGYKYDAEKKKHLLMAEIPDYQMMCGGEGEISETQEPEHIRLSLEELSDIKLLDEYNDSGEWIYGSDTPTNFKPLIINFYQALMDESIKLPYMKNPNFKFIKDLGVRLLDYSNGGGGHYCGYYRSFLIEDINGNSQIYSISLFGTDGEFGAERGEHRKSTTVLYSAVDRGKTSKPVLQLSVDTYMKEKRDCFEITHDGRISSLSSAGVRNYVFHKSPDMERNGQIYLGKLPKDRWINLQDDADFIYKLIEYSVLRDEYRQMIKNSSEITKKKRNTRR